MSGICDGCNGCVAGECICKDKENSKLRNTGIRAATGRKLIGATQTSDDVIQIKDVKKSSPYYKTMSIAVNAGLVKPDSNQKLHPTKKRPISMSHQFLQKFLRQAPKTCWERRQQRQN